MRKLILIAIVVLTGLFSTPAQSAGFGDMGLVSVSAPARSGPALEGVEIKREITYCCNDTVLTVTARISPAVMHNIFFSPLVLTPTPDALHWFEFKTNPIMKVEYGTSPYVDTLGYTADLGIIYPGSITSPGWQPYAYSKEAISTTVSGTAVFSLGGAGNKTLVPGQPLVLMTGQPLSPLTGDSYVTIRISCYLRRAL